MKLPGVNINQHRAYQFDAFRVNPDTCTLYRNGVAIHLEPRVLRLLIYLIENRDRLVPREELADSVWGDTVVSDSALSQAVARLRKALGDNTASPRYIVTVHTQGYRFAAEVEETIQTVNAAASPAVDRPIFVRRVVLAAMASAVLIALSVWLWPESYHSVGPEPGQVKSLAVLPLDNLTGDPGQDYFVHGLQDILITKLSQISDLLITSRQSTLRYRNSELPLPAIAEQLGVDAVVEGSVLRVGDRVEIDIQLIHGQTDKHIWAQHFERDTRHVFILFTDVANAIGSVIDPTRAEQSAQVMASKHAGSVNPRAISAYLKGISNLDRLTPDGLQTALDQLHQATEIEPGFSMAWSYIALTHAILGGRGLAPARESFEKTRAASLKAIEADNQSAMGYSGLGWADLWTLNFQSGCDSFRKALRLNPSEPYAVHGHADCLMLAGRMEESISELRKLRMLGPFTMFNNIPLCFHLFLARRYDEAIAAMQEMHERFPGFSMHMQISLVYWTLGRFEEAIDEERQEFEWRKDAGALAALEAGYSAAGPTGALKSLADFLVARSNETLVDAFRIGEAYARARSVDEAFHWLNVAADQGSFEVIWIGFRPDFDHLRDDPRYAQLMQRIALPANFAVNLSPSETSTQTEE
jgi:TolB-like protein/DNA-binding winged helix-turn-helix (wHTH) protein/Flp pilus assembly protein TadD